jgi:peptidoglycan/LPS O-acetylase OafA/YrhL
MKTNDLPNLDVLRTFAVLAVVLSHISIYEQWNFGIHALGLTGVCLFFVHTCLVLMWSLQRDPHTGRFYIRRWFRLFPLWIVVLTIVVLFKIPTSPGFAPHFGYFAPSFSQYLFSTTMLFNLHFGSKIVGASWSLPVEAQMYILLPVLFFFIRATRAVWILILIDALVIVTVYQTVGYRTTTATTLALCIPYFLPGVMAYVVYQKVKPSIPAWIFPLYLMSMIALNNRFGTHFVSSLWCFAIGCSLPFFHQLTWRPFTHAAHIIARYSYGIYLCHVPAIWFGIHFFQKYGLVPVLLVIVVTTAIPSVILYHLVESPMIRVGGRLAKRFQPGPGPRIDETTLSLEPAP